MEASHVAIRYIQSVHKMVEGACLVNARLSRRKGMAWKRIRDVLALRLEEFTDVSKLLPVVHSIGQERLKGLSDDRSANNLADSADAIIDPDEQIASVLADIQTALSAKEDVSLLLRTIQEAVRGKIAGLYILAECVDSEIQQFARREIATFSTLLRELEMNDLPPARLPIAALSKRKSGVW